MPTLGELGRDYRAVVKAVTPGRYTYVTSIHDRRRYSLFQISIWDDAIDEHLIGVLELSSRKFKDNTVLFLNLARDLMVSLKIRGHHAHYLIEPRPAAQRLVAARLGLSVDGYERLVLEGGLRDLVLRDVAGIRRRYGRRAKSVPAETRDAAGKRPEPTDESGRLETATVALMARLGQGHSRGLVNRDVLASKDAEIAALRGLITNQGLEPPGPDPHRSPEKGPGEGKHSPVGKTGDDTRSRHDGDPLIEMPCGEFADLRLDDAGKPGLWLRVEDERVADDILRRLTNFNYKIPYAHLVRDLIDLMEQNQAPFLDLARRYASDADAVRGKAETKEQEKIAKAKAKAPLRKTWPPTG